MENTYFKIGKVVYPLLPTTNLPVVDIDPTLATIIDYFPSILNSNLMSYWNYAVSKAKLDLNNKIVAQALPYDPLPLKEENYWRFPLFCAFPFGKTLYRLQSLNKYYKTRQIQVNYILPPLSSEQAEYMYPMLTAIENIIADRLHDGFEADYNGGNSVWANCGIKKITLIDSQQGKVPGLTQELNSKVNIFFPAVSFTLEVDELKESSDENFVNFNGVDTSIDLVSEDGTITDFIETKI